MQRIDNRVEKIRYVKTMIEKDIKAEFSRVLERLRSAEGAKTAVLLHELAALQKEVDKIDDLTAYVTDLTKETTDPIVLLVKMRQIADELEITAARPFKQQIDITPDLPMELEQQREKIEKMKISQEIIDFKDNVIARLIKEKEEHFDKVKAEIDKKAKTEIDEWLKYH